MEDLRSIGIHDAREFFGPGERPVYWPGKDHPDREKWLQRRYTPRSAARESTFFASTRDGVFNPGINARKREAETQRQAFIRNGHVAVFGADYGENSLTVLHWKRLPVRVQLLDLRRKAQRQGHVAVEPDAALRAQRERKAVKDYLRGH